MANVGRLLLAYIGDSLRVVRLTVLLASRVGGLFAFIYVPARYCLYTLAKNRQARDACTVSETYLYYYALRSDTL